MRVRIGVLLLVAVLAAGACAPRDSEPNGTADPAGSESGLVTTLEVEDRDGIVRFLLHVTNTTASAVELEFTSGQRYDFQVARQDGETVWTWSATRSFIQSLGTATLGAGESLRYSADWEPGGLTGDFVATGMVTASNRMLQQSAHFTVEP